MLSAATKWQVCVGILVDTQHYASLVRAAEQHLANGNQGAALQAAGVFKPLSPFSLCLAGFPGLHPRLLAYSRPLVCLLCIDAGNVYVATLSL